MSKICDLCNLSIPDSEMQVVSADRMKQAVQTGWRPSRLGLSSDPVSVLGGAFGLSQKEMDDTFCQQVMSDTTDWGLCSTCFEKFQATNTPNRPAATKTRPHKETTKGATPNKPEVNSARKDGLLSGRWGRARYFWIMLAIWVGAFLMMGAMFGEYEPGQENVLFLTVAILQATPVVKRLHDLDRPGSHYWLLLIPLYNVYLGLLLLFKRGTTGSNRYGADPLR